MASSATTTTTYEGHKANQADSQVSDRIHWDDHVAYRNQAYRQLHHQRGVIGKLTVRLLEASNLKRTYWSPLALGPVFKHLGLSTAHGPVSSYCGLSLGYQQHTLIACDDDDCYDSDDDDDDGYYTSASDMMMNGGGSAGASSSSNVVMSDRHGGRRRHLIHSPQNNKKKPPPTQSGMKKPPPPSSQSSASFDSSASSQPPLTQQEQVSPTIRQNNNPVWEHCQFEFCVRKGDMPVDGMRILLCVRVNEDATAFEQVCPGVSGKDDEQRALGYGYLDVTELCLGEESSGTPLPGVIDRWIPITLFTGNSGGEGDSYDDGDSKPPAKKQHSSSSSLFDDTTSNNNKLDPLATPAVASASAAASSSSSMLDTSEIDEDEEDDDYGIRKDKAAAAKGNGQRRRRKKNKTTTTTGMVRVLVSYKPHGLDPSPKDIVALECFARRSLVTSTCRPLLQPNKPLTVIDRRGGFLLCEHELDNHNGNGSNSKACVRIHRNTCFVIERTSLMDAAQNLILLPTDVILSTPVGAAASQALTPAVVMSKELLMPALLSVKLVWMAVRTTTLASWSGVTALGGTLLSESTRSLLGSHHEHEQHDSRGGGRHRQHRRPSSSSSHHNSSNMATAQFVQL